MSDSEAPSTEQLINAAQEGDRDALEILIRRFLGRLTLWISFKVSSKLKPKVEVEDVLQETLLQACKSLSNFTWQGEYSFFSWLRGISENVIKKKIRSIRPTLSLSGSDDWYSAQSIEDMKTLNPIEKAITEEEICILRRELKTVMAKRPLLEHILLRKYIAGESTKSIENELGISRGNARVKTHRLLKALEKELTEKLSNDSESELKKVN